MPSRQLKKFDLKILIPLYNMEAYLASALESICQQQTEFHYQVVLINDGSTDQSLKVANNFKKKFSAKKQSLKIINRQQNQGLLATICRGYEELDETDFFTVLDPDDYWLDNQLVNRAVAILKAQPTATIYFNNVEIKTQTSQSTDQQLLIDQEKAAQNFTWDDYLHDRALMGHTSATFFRSGVINKKIINQIKSKIGTNQEKFYRGDSFRNLIHLHQGMAIYEPIVASVYRLHEKGIWTSLNNFQKNTFNAGFYAEMDIFFDKKEEFFIEKSWRFCQLNYDQINQDWRLCQPHQFTQDDLLDFFSLDNQLLAQGKRLTKQTYRPPALVELDQQGVTALANSKLLSFYKKIKGYNSH